MSVCTNTQFAPKSIWIFFFILLVIKLPSYSQEGCESKIQEAQDFYDQGLIEEIPQLLLPCIEEGFSRVQKIEAYKLLILSYLFDYNQVEAERTMLEFLKKYPEYDIMPNDPVEFVYLFDSFRTTSVFSVGVTTGFNLTNPRIIEPYTVLDLTHTDLNDKMKGGFQIGLGTARYIGRRMLINIELNFAENQYSFSDNLLIPLGDGTEVLNQVTYSEKLYKIEIPVSFVWEFYVRNVHYFLRAGISLAKITGVKGQPSRKYEQKVPPISGEYMNLGDYRKNMLYSAIAGTGIRYKIPRGFITIDLRANFGLNNIVNKKERFNNPGFLSKYYFLDNDFSLNTISLSVGYYFSFYTPSIQR